MQARFGQVTPIPVDGSAHTVSSIDQREKEKEVLIDIRLANLEAERKREQLARIYPKRKRRPETARTVLDGSPLWPDFFARLLLARR